MFVLGRKPNRFHFLHTQQRKEHETVCLVEPTIDREHFRLMSVATFATPAGLPSTFKKILMSWGNTWLRDHLTITGGDYWIHQAIAKGMLVAVTDGSYLRELYPNICSAPFVLECSKGQGRIYGTFSEAKKVANAYRGKLLGLIAIHLIPLSINKLNRQLLGSVEIVSDCLGALKRVTFLPSHRIPSRCRHSDILKTILVHCCKLSFTTYYLHIIAHQDDNASFKKLSRKSQLNCICNHAAKQRLVSNDIDDIAQGGLFLLELVGNFVGTKKMTSDTGKDIRFWTHRQLAKNFYCNCKILTTTQIECINWESIHHTLHNLPRLFQIWAAKHVLGVTGTMKFLAHQDRRSSLCPSCQECIETCTHIARCSETGRCKAFHQSTEEVERWLGEEQSHPDLQSLLLLYIRGRGTKTCLKCTIDLNLLSIFHEFAKSQDIIGWDHFMMGMVSKMLLPIQSSHLIKSSLSASAMHWILGLITQLLQVVHTQWIYRCVLVHDRNTRTLILQHKEEVIKEIKHKLTLGMDSLAKEDRFLLECNFDDLATTTGKFQEYWLLAIRAAREAY